MIVGYVEYIVKTHARTDLKNYLADKTKRLGMDVVPSAIISALRVEGVYDINLTSPAKLIINETEWANCTAISVEVNAERVNG